MQYFCIFLGVFVAVSVISGPAELRFPVVSIRTVFVCASPGALCSVGTTEDLSSGELRGRAAAGSGSKIFQSHI